MEEWNGLFTKHGLKLNLEKTEVLHIGHQREELEGKKLTQRDTERLARSTLQGARHVERMADDRLPKRAAELREQGKRRRGRARLRGLRERCEEGRRGGRLEEEDRGGWKRRSDEAVKQLQAAPPP